MTLCLAWKDKDLIHFSSDSRITFDTHNHCDIGIKVLSVPVRIRLPHSEESDSEKVIYDHDIGVVFSGGALTGYIFKESITEALQSLQIIPGYTEFSFEKLCHTIFLFYSHVLKTLASHLYENATAELVVGGYCPKQDSIRVFRFFVEKTDSQLIPKHEEILTSSYHVHIFGSGKQSAEAILTKKPTRNYLHVLREVIADPSVSTVGGHIQYGKFEDRDFRIFGVVEYVLNSDDLPEPRYNLRGTELYRDAFQTSMKNFHIARTSIDPFKSDFDRLMIEHARKHNLFP